MSYRKKHVRNKINKNKPKKSIFKMPIFWFFLLSLIVFSAGIYFCLFFSKIQIKNITISGNQKVNLQELEKIIDNSVKKNFINFKELKISSNSFFLTNTKNIQHEILNYSPVIKKVTVSKKFPESLNVLIEERKRIAIFCQNEKCFNIDDTGIIFENSIYPTENIFIVRQAKNIDCLNLGTNVISENLIKTITEIEKSLKNNFQINLIEALIINSIRMDIKTEEGWQIYFDTTEDSNINLQLTKLNLLLKDEITPDIRQNLEYIDLRFKDRAYYK
jgi:cell division septal protein FtsQ